VLRLFFERVCHVCIFSNEIHAQVERGGRLVTKENDLFVGGFRSGIAGEGTVNHRVGGRVDRNLEGLQRSREDHIIKEGDIVTFDIVVTLDGYMSDSATTWPVGKINKEKEHLLYHTEKSLYVGLKELKAGVPLGNLSARIQQYAEKHGLGVVRELGGHGVGHEMHEDPFVPNFGKYGTGIELKKGMVIAVEPMLTAGDYHVSMLDDDWTIVTDDYSPAAHFEHTVAITEDGYEILTGE
jgi:methionyl aminopeptidase